MAMNATQEISASLHHLAAAMTQKAIADHLGCDASLISRLRSGEQQIGRSYLLGRRLGQLASGHDCHLIAVAHGTGITAIESMPCTADGSISLNGSLLDEMRDAVEAIGEASVCYSAGSMYRGLRAVARLIRAALGMRAEFNARLADRAIPDRQSISVERAA